MFKTSLSRPLVAVLIAFFVAVQGTWALAGTTGTLQGQVTDQKTGAGVSGATVTAAAPSGNATTRTDAAGHYNFLSLTPDTYTVSVDASGYQPASQAGITVFADNVQVVPFHISNLKEIGQVTSRSSNSYVKSGTTNDVYSVNPATQEALQGLGGGGNLNSAYSAVYGTPGVTSFTGNYGFGQTFFIRGGSYDQSGYEYDGVPVNRAFDNYNANSLSTLGQQELQVYTGSSPAGAASSTQVGFINQVIRTGTYPGFGNIGLGIGGPGFYHEAKGEAGGATPNRLFSYYVGVEGVNQAYNILNNQNGNNISPNGSSAYGFTSNSINPIVSTAANWYTNGPWSACNTGSVAPSGSAPIFGIPTCTTYMPYQALYNDMNQDREFVTNFHFGIPHKRDSGRDDVQLLMYNFGYRSSVASSINKEFGGYSALNTDMNGMPALYHAFFGPGAYPGEGGPFSNLCAELATYTRFGINQHNCSTTVGGPNPLPFSDGYIFPAGTSFGQSAAGVAAVPFLFPGSPANRAWGSGINPDYADGIWNDGTVVKLQYQKNIGSNAYLRLLGYTFYSDWLQNGASTASNAYQIAVAPATFLADPVYELNTHTRGLELSYANQINAQNLVSFAANYSTATVLRDNNTSGGPNWLATLGSSVTNFSDGTNCYSRTTGALASCYAGATAGSYGAPLGAPTTRVTATGAANCGAAPPVGLAGTAACAAGASMIVTVPNRSGSYLNRVSPQFSSLSLTDQWRPTDKLNVDLGVRYESYTYNLGNSNYPEYNFWFNQAQQSYCYDPGTGLPMTNPTSPSQPPGSLTPIIRFGAGACPVAPSGATGVHPDGVGTDKLLTNIEPSSLTHAVVSPRVSGTYTFNPDTVVRFSVGRFTQPTPTAFEQYLFGSGRVAPAQQFGKFFPIGYNTPAHDNPVQVSTNFDFSFERHIKGTDMSLKLTPFYRYSQNSSVIVSLAPNFVSAVNVGTQKTSGLEFAFQKGDPGREGFSGQLALTLVNAKIKYGSVGGAPNVIDVFNNYIRAYNNLTSACAAGGSGAAAVGPSDNNPAHFCQAGNGVSAVASPCYDASTPFAPSPGGNANSPVACPAGYAANIIANPYYNLPAQPLLDRNGYYEPYVNYPPGDPNLGAGNTALSPLQISGFISYKRNKLTITPNFTLAQGDKYGDPTNTVGLDPRACAGNQGGAGAPAPITVNPLLPDYQACTFSPYTAAGNFSIPNPYSGKFDGMGQYRNPWQFNMGAQFKYEVSPKVTATLLLANLVNRCFGGDQTPSQRAFAPNNYVCAYGDNTGGFIGTQPGAGFFYNGSGADPANGTAGYPKVFNYPYQPLSGALPFQAYFLLNFKI